MCYSKDVLRGEALALALVLGGCSSVVVEPAPEETCDVPPAPAISLPASCWEDFDLCPAETDGPFATCARRYVCDIPQPDGVDRPGCVRAIDCDCLDAYADACGDFERPKLCEYR